MPEAPETDALRAALRFNDSINERDLDGLAALMTNDHTFIDAVSQSWTGRDVCLENWRAFFDAFPDYRNVFEAISVQGDVVTVVGHSRCSDERLDGPAIWTARITDGRVAEWRVYEDTPTTRHVLGIPIGS